MRYLELTNILLVTAVFFGSACRGGGAADDAGVGDAALSDAGLSDAGLSDAGLSDANLGDAALDRDAATTAPARIGGWITFTRERRPGLDLDMVSGAAYFLPAPPADLDIRAPSSVVAASMEDFLGGFSAIPLDTCQPMPSSYASIDSWRWEDAGDALTVTGPAGTLRVDRVQTTDGLGDRFFYSGVGAPSLFVPDATYTLSAPGGERVGAFEASVQASSDLDSFTPLSGLLLAQHSADLALSWTPAGRGSLVVDLQGGSFGTPHWVCRFTDDGEATIPGSILLNFPQTNDPADPDPRFVDVTITALRYRWTTIDVDGIDAPVVVTFESVSATDIILQGSQCTAGDESACGLNVCNVETERCAPRTPAGETGLCQPCVSGRQCMPGMVCATMDVGDPSAVVGHFCLWRESASEVGGPGGDCSMVRPYAVPETATLIDGGTEQVCGLREASCAALDSFRRMVDCTGPPVPPIVPLDSACAADLGSGVGQGDGLCRMSDAGYRCTIPCQTDLDCPPEVTCRTSSTPSYCNL